MRQVQPIPAVMQLAPTLAQRIRQLRELRNMTVKDLGRKARLGGSRIEDLEAGLETWLSSTDRQLLCKALSIEPSVLHEVEVRMVADDQDAIAAASKGLAIAVLEGRQDLQCPLCGSPLRCSIQHGFDLEGAPIRSAKAFCLQCPFVLK